MGWSGSEFRPMRRPLLLPTVLGVSGIILAEQSAIPWQYWLWASVILLLVGWGPTRWQAVWLSTACLTLGGLAHQLAQTSFSPADLRELTARTARLGTIRGRIAETPALRLTERRGELAAHSSVLVDVSAWQPQRGLWVPATGSILLTLRAPLPLAAFRGRELEAFGTFKAPAGPEAPGLFDYATFLRRQNVHRLLLVEKTNELQLLPTSSRPPWSERFLPWAHTVLARGVPDDESARLLRAMTLGWKTPLTGEVDDVFMRAGTMHVFAISGLHIALLTGMLVQLFRAGRLDRRWAGVIAVPLTWAYVAATGWQPSAVRSAVMASVVVGGWMLRRPGDLLNSLAGAAALLLILEPGQLFQSGFQLSFGAVGGLALLVPPLENRLLGWCEMDPLIPAELRPKWQQRFGSVWRFLALDFSVGLAALLVSLPMTVHHFNLVSPVSLLANLIVVPLSSLALAATVTSLAIAPFSSGLSELFNASGWLWMSWMTALSRWFAAWPGGWWSVAAPGWYWWCGWYAALAGWVRWESRHRTLPGPVFSSRWLNRGFGGAVTLWAVAAGICWGSYRRTPRLFIFRSEPGLVLETVDATTLIDGGRTGTGRRIVGPFLRAQGHNQLDSHWVTQGVQRFCGLGPELLLDLPPHEVFVPASAHSRQPLLRRYLSALENSHIAVRPLAAGQRMGPWTVLFPDSENGLAKAVKAADQALVLVGEISGVKVLWLGGASPAVLRTLLRQPERLRADLVVAAAVSGIEPLPEEILKAVGPKLAVVMTAPFPAAAQLSSAARERLHHSDYRVLLTDESGGVAVEFAVGEMRWKTYGPEGPLNPKPAPNSEGHELELDGVLNIETDPGDRR